MEETLFQEFDRWVESESDYQHIAVSSRARFARNLAGFPFAPHAKPDVLERIKEYVVDALQKSEIFKTYRNIKLSDLSKTERTYLKESRLISKEMEMGEENHLVYLAPDLRASILVNEEDHLRLQVMNPGLEIESATERLRELDKELSEIVAYAFSEKFGYLTACPTNVGTAFRASAMLHLPGLTLLQEVETSLQGIAHYGLTVRGFYGENSEYAGDFYQISNEITLGKTVEEIVETLKTVIRRIIDREEEARATLFKNHATTTNDSIWRSYALLTHARKMDSNEAMRLLSRLRLGIDQGYFAELAHKELNKLVLAIQPAHLELKRDGWGNSTSRDEARAQFLRQRIQELVSKN